jgi:hypothetical protein
MNHFRTPVAYQHKLYYYVLLAGALVLIFAVSAKAFASGNMFLLFSLVAMPLAVLLVQRLRWWMVLSIGLFNSWLYLPGFPNSIDLYHVSVAAMLPVLFAAGCIKSPASRNSLLLKALAVMLLCTVAATIYVRGLGFAFTGGEISGGAPYVQIALALFLFLFSDSINFEQRHWKWMVILFYALGFLPALADIAFLASGGQLSLQYMFVRSDAASLTGNLAQILGRTGGVFRLHASKNLAYVLVLALALLPYRRKGKIGIWISGGLALLFVGLSGQRQPVLFFLVMIPLLMFFSTGRVPLRLLMCYLAGLILLCLFMANWGSVMPLAIQRALSWLPFADISYVAERSAQGTIQWRFEVWHRLVSDYLPEYWLIGRGFGFATQEMLSFRPLESVEWAILTHNYHSGPLTLLVDLGIFGLVLGYGLLSAAFVRHYRLLKQDWVNEALARYHRVLFAAFATLFILRLVAGNQAWIVQPILMLVMLEGMHRTNKHMLRHKQKDQL